MMPQIRTVQEGLQSLFVAGQREPVEFEYEKADQNCFCDYIAVGQDRIPVFSWRYAIKNYGIYATIPSLGRPSTLKTLNFAPRTRTMEQELFRELDLAEFFLRSEVKSIMGYGDTQAANFIVRLKNGTIANLEMSVTMPAEARREVKHTVFTSNGMVSDMVTDNVLIHEQVHVFNSGKTPVSYTDNDVNLFGLSLEDQDICYAIYALLDGREDKQDWKNRVPHLASLVEGAIVSLYSGEKFVAAD